MSVNDFVLARGMADTRAALQRWNAAPRATLRTWAITALAVAVALLTAVAVVASVATPDPTPAFIPGASAPPQPADMLPILGRNSLVLALHAVACVAGFIAGSSLALSAERRSGLSRLIHEKARPVALGWVVAVTGFSLVAQAYALGLMGANLAGQLLIAPGLLILTVLPHALPELTALFLPLAAWTVASRRGEWRDLLAATVVTVLVAAPILLATAVWEVYGWPHLLRAASPLA